LQQRFGHLPWLLERGSVSAIGYRHQARSGDTVGYFSGNNRRRQFITITTCHGPQARGNDLFPRLAGQHADYLVKQALVIQRGLRDAPVMHEVIKDLSQDQMRAVATYLESLSP
jgi:cytochrome c553